jgi:O-methyltransferase
MKATEVKRLGGARFDATSRAFSKAARKTVKETLGRAGVKIILPSRQEAVVQQLHDGMLHWCFPGLEPRPNRVKLMCELMGTAAAEAMYLVNCLHESMAVPGDVCEFGVAQGATSAMIANEMSDSSRTLWLFDSFKGLPRPTEKDVLIDDIFGLGAMHKYEGEMACGTGQVTRRLAAIEFPAERVRIVPGFISRDERVKAFPEQVCFAYVDFDLYEPVCAALALLQSKLSVGGTILVDDYGYFSEGARTAVDEFVLAHGDEFDMVLPPAFAGQFCMLRRVAARQPLSASSPATLPASMCCARIPEPPARTTQP